MSEIDEETMQLLKNMGTTPEEWFKRCCGCEKLIPGVVVQRDGGATMCADCSIRSQQNDDSEWDDLWGTADEAEEAFKSGKSRGIVFSLPDEDDEEDTLTEYEQMVEKILDEKAERIGMINAGWKQTESGVFYYPDDDNPNIIHLSY